MIWKLFAYFGLAAGLLNEDPRAFCELDGGFSMIQRQAVARPRPWEVHRYLLANYHKSGVHLSAGIFFSIFAALGVPKSSVGNVVYPCSLVNMCFNSEAPVLMMTDSYNGSAQAKQSHGDGDKALYTTLSVRDPLVMVASAYCYHRDGHEPFGKIVPEQELHNMPLKEGIIFTADRILPLIQDMVAAVEVNRTHILSFERLTESSESFDREVNSFMDFMFSDLIADNEREQALEGARSFDARRNPSQLQEGHANSKDCEQKALTAFLQMDHSMVRSLRGLREKLGYKWPPKIRQ